ncbi:Nucleic-acid-binding protein from transposon X-element [Eumeta japonica]|uniref:Nucleic-acid-binding protein from transposon X-element n=1 Tax=Eumeta variegata TaxID=151549 RepID=A0A4C1X4R0_EUMVA|nr:Nucleic-acid-binding protein from transposon X-element [Eumeta japonica]
MESKPQVFLAERGHFDLLREFEANCASPASPDPQVVVFDPEMDLEYTLPRDSKKRPAAARPSKGTSSDSDSDPGSSDSSDHSGFTTVRRRKAAKASQPKPEASCLTQTPDGSTYFRLTSSKAKRLILRKTPQGAVDIGNQSGSPAAAKNNLSDEADVTVLHPAPRARNHHPSEANDKATKAAFFKIRSICSLSGVKAEQPRKRALSGQCHNCQSYGHSSRYCFHSARCVKCLGDHGTAQCTRNKDTDGPPACVLCKQKGHTANYLGCPRAPKRAPSPEKAAPARAVSSTLSYYEQRPDRVTPRPPRKITQHPQTI